MPLGLVKELASAGNRMGEGYDRYTYIYAYKEAIPTVIRSKTSFVIIIGILLLLR